MMGSTVCEGDHVVIDNSSILSLCKVVIGNQAKLSKTRKFNAGSLIGHHYGSTFRLLDSGELTLVENFSEIAPCKAILDSYESSLDNIELFQDPSKYIDESEERTPQVTDDMSFPEAIQTFAENSASFEKRTSFSQEKYLLKKRKKHIAFLNILKPTSDNLCRYYFQKSPHKINYIRPDYLSQMIYYSSVTYNSRVLLFESTQGLFASSLLCKVGVDGHLVQLHCGSNVSNRILSESNIPNDYMSHYRTMSLDTLSGDNNSDLEEQSFDSVIIACRHHPIELVKSLLKFASPSATFLIFHKYEEPLIECYSYLLESKKAILLNVSTSWFRQIQVLDGRSHPFPKMYSSDAYILRCIVVN